MDDSNKNIVLLNTLIVTSITEFLFSSILNIIWLDILYGKFPIRPNFLFCQKELLIFSERVSNCDNPDQEKESNTLNIALGILIVLLLIAGAFLYNYNIGFHPFFV